MVRRHEVYPRRVKANHRMHGSGGCKRILKSTSIPSPRDACRSPAMFISAPLDGSPLHLGYQDVTVSSPDGQTQTMWRYVTEPAHGDGLFEVRFAEFTFPYLFWGRGHAWSPHSDYFTVEQFTARRECFLWVVRAVDCRWYRLPRNHSVRRFHFPIVEMTHYGDNKDLANYQFSGNEIWRTIA